MSWTDWTSGEWLGKWMPQWPPSPAKLPEAIAESMSRLVDVFGFSPARFLHDTVSVASSGLVGRVVETTIGGEVVHFVLGKLGVEPPQYGPLVGQFGEVHVELRDVRWSGRRVERLRIRAENVHIQPGVPSTIVAAPVTLSGTIDQAEIAALLAETTSRVVVRVADGVATAALTGRERWGHVEIVPTIRENAVRLAPVAMVLGRRRLQTLARLIPSVDFQLPATLAHGRFTDVALQGDRLRVDAVVDEWREPLQPAQLQDLERRLRRPGRDLFRLPRGRTSTAPGQPGERGQPASPVSNR